MTSARVTVVVVTWNNCSLLMTCLASLQSQSLPTHLYHVVVVDNASEDETCAAVSHSFPSVELLRSPSNVGFSGGASLALEALMSPYAVLLNDDAVADPKMLQSFISALEAPGAERVGAVTGRVVLTGSGLLNSTGNLVSRQGRGRDRDWLGQDDGRRPAGDVFGFCGAAVALRMAAVREVGSIDPSLFLYYEDTDLSWRLRAAGWTIRYEPSAIAEHEHAASSREGSPLFHYWNERNSLIVFTRHAPAHLVVATHVRRAVGLLVHTARAPRSAVTAARWRAARDHVRRLPETMRERRGMWRNVKVSRAEVARLLERSVR